MRELSPWLEVLGSAILQGKLRALPAGVGVAVLEEATFDDQRLGYLPALLQAGEAHVEVAAAVEGGEVAQVGPGRQRHRLTVRAEIVADSLRVEVDEAQPPERVGGVPEVDTDRGASLRAMTPLALAEEGG